LLKTKIDGQTWLISQPGHAAVSGYLSAHWGNGEFTKPGHFGTAPNPGALRAETIFAIAEHDNGWWEWEGDPQIDPADGLPLHLTDLSPEQSFERWRLGVPRFRQEHPYTALLISLHAYRLYAFRVRRDFDPLWQHPLFGGVPSESPLGGPDLPLIEQFEAEQKREQEEIIQQLSADPAWTAAVQPEILNPHARLLQLADALSLVLCFGARKPLRLAEIPKTGWDDRVTLELSPQGRRIVCRPYPFDLDPLPVALRARILQEGDKPRGDFQTWWHGVPRQQIGFEFCSR
jgi:hypothetical protein